MKGARSIKNCLKKQRITRKKCHIDTILSSTSLPTKTSEIDFKRYTFIAFKFLLFFSITFNLFTAFCYLSMVYSTRLLASRLSRKQTKLTWMWTMGCLKDKNVCLKNMCFTFGSDRTSNTLGPMADFILKSRYLKKLLTDFDEFWQEGV